jgi:hypothetical protein
MKTLYAPLKFQSRVAGLANIFLLLLFLAAVASAQSIDLGYPTPVRSGEISGSITPRDLGDARLTRYYYLFTGTAGDLIVTAESDNLEGDVDIFTAGVLRPLAKISLYAGISRSGGSKTIYLRTRQPLILRVEARTPNDNPGNFRIRFEGAFEPVGSEVPDPEPPIPTLSSEASAPQKGRRVTATGARIDEPEPVATTQPDAQPTTPAAEPAAETPATNTPAESATTTPPSRPRTPRNRRSRTSGTARNSRTRPQPTTRQAQTPEEPAVSAPAAEPAAGPRLIIETKDGMRIERYMTNVRRVTVERGLIVIVNTDGKVERQAMTNVLRMAIEP